jgi:methyl-accepting chemotaxis protein
MSNNLSLLPLTAALLIASGLGAGYTGYHFIKHSDQDKYLLAQVYEAQTKGLQTVYLAERAAIDSSYTSEMESLDAAVERALAGIRNGDPVQGIAPAPEIVLRNLESFQKTWDEIAPAITQILSQRGATNEFTRNLAETRTVAKDALAAAKSAVNELPNTTATPAIKTQLTKVVSALEDGVNALLMDTDLNTDSLRAAQASIGEYVSSLSAMGASLPKEQGIMTPLGKSYADAKSVQRLMIKTITSSSSAGENIPHAKTIWATRDRLTSASAAMVASVQGLPESRAYGITVVAGLGALTILLALGGMLLMRSITYSHTSRVQSQGKNLERSTQTKSRELQALLDGIQRLYNGDLNTHLNEDNESTKEIAKSLNIVFAKVKSIIEEVTGTIDGLSAATEQALVMDKNVAKNRSEQDGAISDIDSLFKEVSSFIDQIDAMTTDTQKTSGDVLERVRSGADAVTQVHENIVALQQQTTAIQHRSKHLIESFQTLERISEVVREVSERAKILAFNGEIIAGSVDDKKVSSNISQSATAMQRLSSEARQAVSEINLLLKQMMEAARDTQSAVDSVQREAESLRHRSNTAQTALGDINEMTTRLTHGVTEVKGETQSLKSRSGEITETMSALQHYSTENSAASEQTANAIKSVNLQAQELETTIAQFTKV